MSIHLPERYALKVNFLFMTRFLHPQERIFLTRTMATEKDNINFMMQEGNFNNVFVVLFLENFLKDVAKEENIKQ